MGVEAPSHREFIHLQSEKEGELVRRSVRGESPLTIFRVWLQKKAHPYTEGVVMETTHPEEVGGWKRP